MRTRFGELDDMVEICAGLYHSDGADSLAKDHEEEADEKDIVLLCRGEPGYGGG